METRKDNRLVRSPLVQRLDSKDISTISQETNTSVTSEQFAVQMKRNKTALADVLRLLSDEECLPIRERHIAEQLGAEYAFSHYYEDKGQLASNGGATVSHLEQRRLVSPPRLRRVCVEKELVAQNDDTESVPTPRMHAFTTDDPSPHTISRPMSTTSSPTPGYNPRSPVAQRGTYVVPKQVKIPVIVKAPTPTGPAVQYQQACRAAHARIEEDYKFYNFRTLAVSESFDLERIEIPSVTSNMISVAKLKTSRSGDDTSELGSPRSRASDAGTPVLAERHAAQTEMRLVTTKTRSVRSLNSDLSAFLGNLKNRL